MNENPNPIFEWKTRENYIMIERENETLWVEKYRPHNIDECILPKRTKDIFKGFIEKKEIPNLLLHSRIAGVGKTSCARILAEELGYEVLFINASLENGIDVLRNKIANFASTVSFFSSKKCVILDEADALNPNSIQPALRGFIEQFSQSVRFIFTCNYVNKILPPIVSRCTVIDFNVPNNEKKDLLKQSLERLEYILTNEGVKYDRKTVAKMLLSHYPDMRRTINELQRYSAGGEIDDGIMVNMNHDNFNQLVKFLREKNFKDMRLWVANNKDIEPEKIFSFFFENANKFMKPESVPQLIIMTDRYQYMGAFVVDQEINTTAYLTEVMANCEFTRPE